MTFKAGDKVRYTGDCNTFSGRLGGFKPAEGVITEPGSGTTHLRLTSPVQGYREGSVVGLFTSNLELITPAFTFADIQVGDKIRRTLTRDTGTTEVREGVVVEKSGLYALDAKHTGRAGDSYILAYNSDSDPAKPQVVLELLDRPEKEPELWENRKAGDKITSYDGAGKLSRIFTKREDGDWDTLVLNCEGKIQKGFLRSQRDLSQYISKHNTGGSFQLVR